MRDFICTHKRFAWHPKRANLPQNQDFVNFFANEVVQNLIFTGKKEEVMNIINKMPVRQIQNHAFKNNKDLSFTDTSLDLQVGQHSNNIGKIKRDSKRLNA